MPKIVAIAGNSGSGKSSVATSLKEKYQDKVSIVFLDDYQKKKEKVPELKGMKNWDCPEAVNFEKLKTDFKNLLEGDTIEVMSWVSKVNPDYHETGERIPYKIEPKNIIILEGYFALLNPEIRNLTDNKIFLDIPIEESLKRREKPVNSQKYKEEILIPMAKKYVEPTKSHADKVIDSQSNSKKEVVEEVEKIVL